MTTVATGVRAPRWRHALTLTSAIEATVTALWLAPASIHIVQWPASGPVRVGLLAPATELAWLLAGGALASIAATLVLDGARLARVATCLAPLSWLWLLAVPYLPVAPDRAPLLLVLAGPLRWAVAALAIGVSMWFASTDNRRTAASNSIRTQEFVSVTARMSYRPARAGIFAISLAFYLLFGLLAHRAVGLGGDEPHYLIITESLLKDRDLEIENNHQRRDYRSFFGGELRPDYMQRGQDGAIYSIHAPGLPAALLPAYAAGGATGAVVFLCIVAALTALAVFDLARDVAGDGAALATWAGVCLTVPFVPHSWLIFPEMPGALLVAWAVLWLWRSPDRAPGVWLARGAALALLPWLHTKFVVFLAILGGMLALRLVFRPRALAAFVLPLAVSVSAWLYSFYVIYGSFNPEAPYGAYSRTYVLTRYIPHGLIGILFDQKFGLFVYSPIFLAAIPGAWLLWRRYGSSPAFAAGLLVTVAAFVVSTARLYMFWGGSSAPARFLVPVIPCLAPMVAAAIADLKGTFARAAIGVALAVSIAIALAGIVSPAKLMLFSDPHGRARILEAVQGASPLALVVPTFTEPDWASEVPGLLPWLISIAIGVAVAAFMAMRGSRPLRIAAVAPATILLVAGVLTARPEAAVREATARRGAGELLWRFDGERYRTLDYSTLARTTPERLRELTTITAAPRPAGGPGVAAGPFALPQGEYEAVVWFTDTRPRAGDVLVSLPPRATFARHHGPLENPTTIPFTLPIGVGRLMVSAADSAVASAIADIRIVPRAVRPPSGRVDVPVRSIESIDGTDDAYIVYTDEHAYPEGGVFWTRGTAQTTVYVARGRYSRMNLTLFTGPMSGRVDVEAANAAHAIDMRANETSELAVPFTEAPLVPLRVRSSVMFRPGEIDASSTDMRGLGCQVRVSLE